MALREGLTPEWWHGMKATICDFCGKVTKTTDRKAMLYDIHIMRGDGYEANSKEEKAVLIAFDDVCMPCAKRVHDALVKLKREPKP